ncbi:hypothetical protein SteCoe_21569 [Stentor coeruleus]|uniref:Uncharacterized protein n=1 Tax=Stentor coeruleus TaxID=5963 RepID=A0A1R2BP20_9CILI|nr:hypothetical protein SteCoe_21569 [Stentor coeruleus]
MESEVVIGQEEEKVENQSQKEPAIEKSPQVNSEIQDIEDRQPESSPAQNIEETPRQSQNPEDEKNDFPTIHISLKPTDNNLTDKKNKHDKAESLFEKDSQEKAKFNCYKQKCKAKQIGDVREAPEINKTSVKLLTKKSTKNQKAKAKAKHVDVNHYDPSMHESVHSSDLPSKLRFKEFTGMAPDLMKESMKIRSDYKDTFEAPNDPGYDVLSRSKAFLNRKDKETNEKKRSKESLEMSECTFKPCLYKKTSQNNTGNSVIVKHSKSVSLSNETKETKAQNISILSVKDLSSRVPPPSKGIAVVEKPGNETENTMLSDKYFQLSPFTASVRYKTGYNQEEMKNKAHPMVNYRLMPNQSE